MTKPPEDELERSLWMAGVKATPEQIAYIRRWLQTDTRLLCLADPIGWIISLFDPAPWMESLTALREYLSIECE